ncbi:tryptophan halogenase family protein [Sandarakinorhabdus sp. AAP62]|uniref:tryptophan halogenase family protein n=1 Tax=Sandarakinorhabdus sp. AAP62 TaxID=1248916 RepID=UPI0002F610B7|nr:tryptophan halogenase family protein [Sandarakinorhabdus sp. AAP62]
MSPAPLRQLVIAGGGTAGWMTAAAATRFLERGWQITLVESDAIGTVGVGEATIPQIRLFNAGLGIDENEFLAATQGSFKLGIEFVDWWQPGQRYMHNFGEVGRALGLVPFHHWWARARAEGQARDFGHYSLNERAARAHRFDRLAGDATLPPLVWAYHFDAGLYAAYLRRRAEARGVVRVEGRIARVEREGETITTLVLDDGRRIAGDLFVDCSGFRSLLIGEALGSGWHDWSHWLPCDRAVAVPCANGGDFTPYTRATARPAGWQWRIPLQHRIGNGHVFSSAHMSEDEATAILMRNLDGEPLAEPRTLAFQAGRRDRVWIGNCYALGLAAGFLEPLESTSIHLIQSGIARLLGLLPGEPAGMAVLAAEANREAAREMEWIRDFIILHYKANQRPDPFWRAAAAMAVPPELAERMALFAATGRIRRDHDELFTDLAWSQVMIGQGLTPATHHPLADGLSAGDLGGFLGLIDRAISGAVTALPGHADFLARHCPAPRKAA